MNYASLKAHDIANGPGIRVTLFVSGCTHHCLDCFQPETWDFNFGQPFTEETTEEILRLLAPDYITGLTLLGGEPFEPCNQVGVLPLLQRVKVQYPEKTIWAFSGYVLEQLCGKQLGPWEITKPLLDLIDVLVDGPFVAAKKDLNLRFRGSSNQRLIDLRKTRMSGGVVLWDDGR